MSHVATVNIEVKDLDALKAACGRIGLEFVEGQKTYRWFDMSLGDYPLPAGFTSGELGTCEHAIRRAGDDKKPEEMRAYEIGVCHRRDGKPGYVLLWDFFGGGMGLERAVGVDCCKLKQAYGAVVARQQAMRMGFHGIQEVVRADGTIQLTMHK